MLSYSIPLKQLFYEGFTIFHLGLPIGEEVVLVALGTDGQNNFYASKEIKIGQNEVIDVALEAVSVKELKQKIKQWDKL